MEIKLVFLIEFILIVLIVVFILATFSKIINATCNFFRSDEKRINSFLIPFLSLGWSIILCLYADSDLFCAFGYWLCVPYLSNIVTGIAASFIAIKIYDFIINKCKLHKDFRDKSCCKGNCHR